MQKLEPIFSRQEQAVVYLFSRYWDRIPEFKNKTILRIHTCFPDFTIVGSAGEPEAIEFEYGLHDFCSHLDECLKRLNDDGCRRLYIVYWDDTGDENELCERIQKKGFKGKVECVCLKDYFSAFVGRIPEKDSWHAAWEFSKKRRKPAYLAKTIEDATNKLEPEKMVARLPICLGLYRTIGFDKKSSDFIECDHWRNIHFFTTRTRFQADSIPSKLFVRPSGCEYFDGYFEIRSAFKIVKRGKSVGRFFKDFYFYNYKENDEEYFENSTCFTYSDFRLLTRERGQKLFSKLVEKNYTLGIRGSMKIKAAHKDMVDRVTRM